MDTATSVTNMGELEVERLVDNSQTDFDLFVRLADMFVLYAGPGYRWERAELNQLLSSGHQALLYRVDDLSKVEQYLRLAKLPALEANTAPHERIRSIEQVGAAFIECLFKGEVTSACIVKARQVADGVVHCVGEDPTCVQALSGLGDHHHYTYSHNMRVSAYAVAVAWNMGCQDEQQLSDIALGGIFHDIGKKVIPNELLDKSGPLTNDEWGVMQSHPLRGHQSIETSPLSYAVREIILHHHEKCDGSGYPDHLVKNALMTEVQIATLTDVYDAMTSSRAYQNKRSRFEALDFMRHKLVGPKIAPDLFRALVACLAK